MVEWTKEQKKAIDIRNANLLVSAAAGSGKTAVLVQRIINMIKDDKVDIDRFLIVTFTNAAANGMKQKIQKAISLEIQNNLDDNIYLRKQLNLLGKAQISTIHSFCLDVIRKNFHLIGIDPNFRIGNNDEVDIMFNEALDEIIEKAYLKNDDGFIKLVESFTGNRNDYKLLEIIKDIYYFALSFPKPLDWLQSSIDKLINNEEKISKTDWIEVIIENLNILVSGGNDLIEEAKHLCSLSDNIIPYIENINNDLCNINILKNALGTSYDAFINSLYSLEHTRLKSIKAKEKENYSPELLENLKGLRDEYKKIIESIKNLVPNKKLEQYAEELKTMHPIMNSLYQLIYDLNKLFKDKKLDKAVLDFNDIEHYALELLSKEEVSNLYKRKFEYIFIDEYQDSNQIQETIINQIKRKNNLFMVGDIKQSIYRFRLADPSLFIEKYKTFNKEIDHGNIRVDLMKNFRSRNEIITGINFLFNKLMSEKIGEINYNEEVFLYNGMKFENSIEMNMELNIINKKNEEEGIDEELKSMKTAEIEARLAAQKVKELIGKEIYIAADKVYRKVEYKDIVILLRAVSNWSGTFEEIFLEEGIPFYSDTGSGYFECIEIQIIINLLKLIDNIRQDIPLMSVMKSSIGKFSIEEMILIRAEYPKTVYIDACINYKNEKEDELSKKINIFLEEIKNWKEKSRYTRLNELIWEILIDTGYYYFAGILPNGKMRQANLRLLTDKALEFEKTSMRGLFKFLRYVEKLNMSTNDTNTAKILGENDNVTRLMSIHKSKGLEFPVVILCGLNKRFNMKDVTGSILMHKKYGLAPKYVDLKNRIYKETLPGIALKNAIKIENLSEEMRVLYVALTRAINKLILIGTVNNIETKSKKWKRKLNYYNIYYAASYLDWICTSLYNHKDAKPLRYISEGDLFKLDSNDLDSRWNISVSSLREIEESNKDNRISKVIKIEEIQNYKNNAHSNHKEEILRRLNWVYDYKQSVDIPSKLSVTDIKRLKNTKIEHVKYKIPSLKELPFFKENKIPFTKQEIGTITHFVMQHLDISQELTEQNILMQIREMVDKKLLTEKEGEVINIKKISYFFNTDIGIRMKSSPIVKREIPFVMKKKASEIIENISDTDNVLIQGIIDCYFYENNEIVLLDYKTDAVFNNRIDIIINQYKPQIISYKEALEKLTGFKVKSCYLYLFDVDRAVPIVES